MNKLILLDGTHGVGKTTTAQCICAISNGEYICIDPDSFFNSNAAIYSLRGGWPVANNSIIRRKVRTTVENNIQGKNVVIPLTLNSQEYIDIWTELFQDIADVSHVILYANKETMMNRINNDEGRDNEFATDNLDINDNFYQKVTKGAVRIDTSDLSPEVVAKKILEIV